VTTILLVLAIWLLINVLFCVVMMPPRKPRNDAGPKGQLARVVVDNKPAPFERRAEVEPARPSFGMVIVSVVMGTVFLLAPLIDRIADSLRGLIKKRHADPE
jgi:hypothetical protein